MSLVIIILIILLVYILYIFNKLIKYKNNVGDAFSTMDVYLKKRWDLIPNIVEVVKGHSKYESETLENIINLRNNSYDGLNSTEKIDISTKLNDNLKILIESYPDLKTSDSYKDLMKNLTKVEDEIANSRKYYNATIREYNNLVEVFPSNIIAKILGFKKMNMFIINEDERENVEVNLNG